MMIFRRRKRKEQSGEITGRTQDAGPLLLANLQGIGERDEQQDAFGLSRLDAYREKGLLAVLCDGMGGMESGRAIALRCVGEILDMFPLPADDASFQRIDENLIAISNVLYENYGARGGATLVLCYIRDGGLFFRCMGDSDLFLIRDGSLYQMNEHQVHEVRQIREHIRSGFADPEIFGSPQGGALTGFMGCERPFLEGNRVAFPLNKDDVLMLCSDGVSGTLTRLEIKEACEKDPEEAAALIGRLILEKKKENQDNYTAIICKYRGDENNEEQ